MGTMSDGEADLLALMRDQEVRNKRKTEEAAVDVGAELEALQAAKRPRPQATDDKINGAFKRATSC
jgi:hypothetical protein